MCYFNTVHQPNQFFMFFLREFFCLPTPVEEMKTLQFFLRNNGSIDF